MLPVNTRVEADFENRPVANIRGEAYRCKKLIKEKMAVRLLVKRSAPDSTAQI
jgi:hypothetical protein